MGSREHRAVTDSSRREREIVDVLMALHEGEVTTYGDVAAVAGHPKQSRLVGRILATTEFFARALQYQSIERAAKAMLGT